MNVKAWYRSLIKGKQTNLDAHVSDYRLSHLPQHVLDQLEGCRCDFYLVTDNEGMIQYYSKTTKHYLPQNIIDRPYIYQWLYPDARKILLSYVKGIGKELSPQFITLSFHSDHDIPLNCEMNALSYQQHCLFVFQQPLPLQPAEMTPDQERLITIGEMAAGLVHEFKNPLTSLNGFIELIKAGVPYEKEYFRVISDELQRMDALTTELLTLSKPAEASMSVLQLNQLCVDVSILFKHQLNKRQIRLTNHFDQTIYCLGNDCQLKQVLINLIKNAMEAIEEAGLITIELSKLANTAVIKVIDTGKGISEEQLATIMEPFYTTKKTGTGLGLAVTRKIMSNHHGDISAVSTLNKGTTFTLRLPCLSQQTMEQIG